MCVKNASNDSAFWSPGASTTFEIGTSVLANFASWTFFSITRLAPFSRITRSSFGRLKAAVCTPRLPSPAAKISLTTTIGASAPSFGLRYFGSIGRWFSMSCSSPAKLLQLRGLRLVPHRDVRLERGLVVEQLVLVDLVRADGRLDGALQLHPGHVAVVVVVREKRVGALGEERLQRRLGRQLRRLAQQRRGARELALILDAVRHEA